MDPKSRILSVRVAQYVDHSRKEVDISRCLPGSNARAIKPGGVVSLKSSVEDTGWREVAISLLVECYLWFVSAYVHTNLPPQESCLSVRDLGDGTFGVIDGMHRVTTLQMLKEEGFEGPRYDKVPSYLPYHMHTQPRGSTCVPRPHGVPRPSPHTGLCTQIGAVVYYHNTPSSLMLAIAQSKSESS
jgi:hypothetical protein